MAGGECGVDGLRAASDGPAACQVAHTRSRSCGSRCSRTSFVLRSRPPITSGTSGCSPRKLLERLLGSRLRSGEPGA